MLTISQQLTDAIESFNIVPVTLIQLDFPVVAGDVLRITDAPRDISFGGQTYSSADNLISQSAPQTQSNVDRDNYTMVFSDVDHSMRNRFAASQSGVQLTVSLLFRQSDGSLTTDALNVYQGISSGSSWDVRNDVPTFQVGFTGQLAQLSSAKVIYTSDEQQRMRSATDSSMRFVHSTARQLRWGRKS